MMKKTKHSLWKLAACAGTMQIAVFGAAIEAQAAPKMKAGAIEPWAGQRVLLLLPLQLGEGWNADQTFGRAILKTVEERLQTILQDTGKFSVMQAHRFNPLIQRGLQEKRITEEQVSALIGTPPSPGVPATPGTPSLENATALLSPFIFDRPAMIADFRLEEVRAGGDAKRPSVQVQVSGRLYEVGNPVAIKSPVVTSEPIRAGANQLDRFLLAADNAFQLVANELVAPIDDIVLPRVEPAPVAAPGAAGATGETPATGENAGAMIPVTPVTPPTENAGATTPGETSITGASSRGTAGADGVPQLPAATPPLGINVPGAPVAGR